MPEYAPATPWQATVADAGKVMREGITAYIEETRSGAFPAEEHCFKIEDDVISKLLEEMA